jgi:phasin family protein
MSSSSRKKTRTSAGDAMKLVAKPEPALTYAARDSFAFSEGPAAPEAAAEPAPAPEPAAAPEPAPAAKPAAARAAVPTAAKPAAPALGWALPKPYVTVTDPAALLGGAFKELGSGNVEAVARAGAILAKGLEEMSQSVMALGQRNLESSVNLARAAIGTTTLRQLVDLQTGYARDSFDRLVAEGNKLQEISLKTANAALQPLKTRMAEAIETLTSKAA